MNETTLGETGAESPAAPTQGDWRSMIEISSAVVCCINCKRFQAENQVEKQCKANCGIVMAGYDRNGYEDPRQH